MFASVPRRAPMAWIWIVAFAVALLLIAMGGKRIGIESPDAADLKRYLDASFPGFGACFDLARTRLNPAMRLYFRKGDARCAAEYTHQELFRRFVGALTPIEFILEDEGFMIPSSN